MQGRECLEGQKLTLLWGSSGEGCRGIGSEEVKAESLEEEQEFKHTRKEVFWGEVP